MEAGIDISLICRLCLSKQETIDHALCRCKRSMAICDSMFPRIDKNITVDNNFADRITRLSAQLSSEEFEKVCIAFRAIWNDRKCFCRVTPIVDWIT